MSFMVVNDEKTDKLIKKLKEINFDMKYNIENNETNVQKVVNKLNNIMSEFLFSIGSTSIARDYDNISKLIEQEQNKLKFCSCPTNKVA